MGLENSLNLPFLGILEDLDFCKLSFFEQQRILIKAEIFITNNKPQFFIFKNLNFRYPFFDLFDDELEVEVPNKNLSNQWINYFGINYILNPIFLEDVFLHLKSDVYYDNDELIENEKKLILLKASKLLSDSEKIEYYKTEYHKHYNKIKDDENLLCYDDPESAGWESWEQFVISKIRFDPKLIQEHLFNYLAYDTSFSDISKIWRRLNFEIEIMCSLKNLISDSLNLEISSKKIDSSFQISMLEKMMKIENWDDITATKKGEIISHLLGKNKDNIRNIYYELDKKQDDKNSKYFDKNGKYETDRLKAEEIINKLLG